MVVIAKPPPQYPSDPIFYPLTQGSHIVRIFDPTRRATQSLTFRSYGPLGRFDHHYSGKNSQPQTNSDRSIYYAALTLSSCLVEVFGDTRVIEIKGQLVAYVNVNRDLKLLDLRGKGAMKAGSVAALASIPDRNSSQMWSRYFYETVEIYGEIDGIFYYNAHNNEEAIALYERAKDGLECPQTQVLPLNHPGLRPYLQEVARDNNLIIPE